MMLIAARIDVAEGDEPIPGDILTISIRAAGELIGLLEYSHTFRFALPSQRERDYQREQRSHTVISFDLDIADFGGDDVRLLGTLTYSE
jgi:hypothetical protein